MLKTLRKLECVYATAISLVISLIFWRFSSTEQLDFFYFAIALIILFISLWILLLQYLYYEDKLKAISQTHKRQSSNSNRSFKGNIIIVDNDEFSFTSNIPNLFKEGCIIKLTAKTDGLIKQLAYACVTNSSPKGEIQAKLLMPRQNEYPPKETIIISPVLTASDISEIFALNK